MTEALFSLEDVVRAPEFVEADIALRKGRHIDADDGALYTFLLDAQEHLVDFYQRYDCQLLHKPDGYFYLLPSGERLGRRHLSVIEMLVGQALATLYLDPATLETRGVVSRDAILSHLSALLGAEALVRALYPKRKRFDARVAEETARARVFEAIRKLSTLGFVSFEGDGVRLRRALLRFAEPVRTQSAGEELARLAAAGELVLEPVEAGDEGDDDREEPSDDEDGDEDAAL